MRPTPRIRQAGMTVVEVVVVIVVFAILIPIFGAFLVDSYRDSNKAADQQVARGQLLQALSFIEENVRSSRSFRMGVSTPFTDPYGPGSSGATDTTPWSISGGGTTQRTLIVSRPVTAQSTLSASRLPVFTNDGSFDCSANRQYMPELHYLAIFFVRNQTLYRRVIPDTATPICPGQTPAQKRSCPVELNDPLPSGCGARDEVVAERVAAFSVDYGSSGIPFTAVTPYGSTDPDAIAPADTVDITLSLRGTNPSTITTMTQRIVRIND